MATNYLKQFTAWVIDSKNNLFLWARLKLTLLYIVFIAAIIVVFSVSLYSYIDKSVRDTINEKIRGHDAQQDALVQTETNLREEFATGDMLLLFVSGVLAFVVAGNNLRPIKNALEKQKRFTADASHDLRTPLAIMKTDCEVILKKRGVSAEEFRDMTKSNLEEINRMSAMVEQLLFLSRNGNAAKQQHMEKISLGALAEQMVNNFKKLADQKQISLTISESSRDAIWGNRLDLERMCYNILKNAIDYTPQGGTVRVWVRKKKKFAELVIQDTGIGISPEDLPHVTEAFYKADKVRGGDQEGSGLGLSIVEGIIKNHRGEMTILSAPGKGTQISITFSVVSS